MKSSNLTCQKLIILSKKISWFGNHTGYEQLPTFIQQKDDHENTKIKIISYQAKYIQRLIGKLYANYRGWTSRNSYQSATEFYFALSKPTDKNRLSHILYLEDSLPFLDRWKKTPNNLIGTIHLPPKAWNEKMFDNLKRLSSAIILYTRDIEFWEKFVGKNRVKFIHYGVDIDFFYPSNRQETVAKRILFAGHYLRNTKMLYRLITKLNQIYPDLKFDLLVPEFMRNQEGLFELQNNFTVTWHQNLSDESLRQLYQDSDLLLLPMNDSGANTAVVEALACGLPIVTTDVGGIRDYGGGDIFPIIANNDDQAAIDLIEKYLHNSDWHQEISSNCRKFAEQYLDWNIVAQKHLETYEYFIQ